MIGEAVANVVLNVVLCKVLGVFGIILATIISVFLTNCLFCPQLIFKLYFKNGKLKEYWLDHIYYTLTMILTAGISWLACEKLLPGASIGVLIGRGLVCTAVSIILFWLLWHRSKRYDKAVTWLKKMIKV